MPYKCMKCKREVETEEIKKRVRCPYCGYRILSKQRSKAQPVHVETE